ncbi:hypothetical protein [Candidatus Ichthyocystis sparus]|uniref:hypothetical protein n=1 Tax=Candidatus Ichthyocystis sparus TaxID=1561004 RepID=UPI000B827B6E|nr:hypothetical protein [Candidatus Ichthyocystis sparus]
MRVMGSSFSDSVEVFSAVRDDHEQITSCGYGANEVVDDIFQGSDVSSYSLSGDSSLRESGCLSNNMFLIGFFFLVALYILVVVCLTIQSFSFENIAAVVIELGLFVGVIAAPMVMCLSTQCNGTNGRLSIMSSSTDLQPSVDLQHIDADCDDTGNDIDALVASISDCLHRIEDSCGWANDIVAYGDNSVDLENYVLHMTNCLNRMETRADRLLFFDSEEILTMINRLDLPQFPSNSLMALLTSDK